MCCREKQIPPPAAAGTDPPVRPSVSFVVFSSFTRINTVCLLPSRLLRWHRSRPLSNVARLQDASISYDFQMSGALE